MRDSPALIESRAFSVRHIPLLRPLGWLALGWHDLMRCPLPGLLHGLALALFGGALLLTGFAAAPVTTPLDFLRVVVLNDDSPLFQIWLAMGAFLAAPVFASSVVAIPLLLDRQISVLAAVLTSWRVVQAHPLPMALWAALLMALTVLGMATALVGLVVIAPWLAHASWHAYRDLISTSGLAEQP